jgi:PAS domain S-box-containing protein
MATMNDRHGSHDPGGDSRAVMAAARAWLASPEHVADRFRLFFEDAPIAMMVGDRGGRIVAVNRALCDLLGWGRDGLLERSLCDFTHPDDRSREADALDRMLAGRNESYALETRYRRNDGGIVHALVRGSLLRDPHGASLGALTQVVDITARKNAETALRQSEILFRSAFEAAPLGLAIESFDGRLVRVNPALCALTGREATALLRDGLTAALHPDDHEPARHLLALLEGGVVASHTLQERYQRPDGTLVWAQRTSSAVADPAGMPVYVMSQIQDITEERASHRAALREPVERFRIAFDKAPIGMALIGTDGRFLRVNAALCQITGYTEQEMLQATFASLTHPDDRERDTDALTRFLSGRIDTYITEKRYVRRDGRVAWVQLHVSSVSDPGDRLLYFITQVVDISARKRAEETLWEGEERFRIAFEEAPIGMALVATSGRIMRMNHACAAFLGLRTAAANRLDLTASASSDDREPLAAALRQAGAAAGARTEGTWSFLQPDGRVRRGRLILSAVTGSRGAVPAYLIAQILDAPDGG